MSKLLSDRLSVVLGFELEIGPEQVDDGEVGRGLVVGHRAAFEDEPAGHTVGVGELPEEAGFAHAGLADDGHHLAVTGTGLLQGLAQGLDLSLPSHKGGEAAGCGSLEAPARGSSANEFEDLYRVR